jgi:hypothetical protein
MKRIIIILAILLAHAAMGSSQPRDARTAPASAKPLVGHPGTVDAGVPSWGLGPFVRDEGADFIRTNPHSVFKCPVRKKDVHWEDQAILCAAAVVKNDKVYIFYRAEDSTLSQPAAGKYHWGTSRIGIATSEDGRHFQRYPDPVLYPAEDEMKDSEWPGGCQDPRVVETRDGIFVMTYTAYEGNSHAWPSQHQGTCSTGRSRVWHFASNWTAGSAGISGVNRVRSYANGRAIDSSPKR